MKEKAKTIIRIIALTFLLICVSCSRQISNKQLSNNKNIQNDITPQTSFNNGEELKFDCCNYITDFEYDDATDFNTYGRAIVTKNGKQYVIDTSGKIVCEYMFGELYYRKFVKKGEYYAVINDDYETLATDYIFDGDFGSFYTEAKIFPIRLNGKWGLINREGKTIIDYKFDKITIYTDCFKLESNNKCGYADESGKLICDCIYDDGSSFCEGLCGVKLNDKFGYIDVNGNVVIDFIYEEAGDFNESRAFVKNNDNDYLNFNCCGYIDKEGKHITALEYCNGYGFQGGFALAKKLVNSNDPFGDTIDVCIDKTGNIKFSRLCSGDYYDSFRSGLLYHTDKYNNHEFINSNGECMINLGNNEAKVMSSIGSSYGVYLGFKTNYAVIENVNEKFWIIDIEGNKISDDYDNIKADMFMPSIWYIEKNGKIGCMNNENANILIDCIADDLSLYENGYGIMTIKDKKYLINHNGEKIIDYSLFDDIKFAYNVHSDENSISPILRVKKDDKYAYIILKKMNEIIDKTTSETVNESTVGSIDYTIIEGEKFVSNNISDSIPDYKLFKNSYDQYESRIKELGSELVEISAMPDTGGTYKIYKTKSFINYEDKMFELVLCFMFPDNGKEFLYSIKFVEIFQKEEDTDFIANSVKAFNNYLIALSGYEKLSCYIDEPRQDYSIETDAEKLKDIIISNKIPYNDYTDVLGFGIVNAYYNDGYIDNFVSLYPYLDGDNICSKIYLVNGLSVSSEYFNQLMGYNKNNFNTSYYKSGK